MLEAFGFEAIRTILSREHALVSARFTVGACDYLRECLTQLFDHWLAISRFVFESPPGIFYLIACKALDYIDKVKFRLRTISSSNIKPQDIRVQLTKLIKTY